MRIIVRVATRDANNERDNIKGDKPSCQRTLEEESRREGHSFIALQLTSTFG
ncbi:hypothetical protein J0B03_06050 [Alkalibacter rhizosphaerae]|uniref:Uncharacterized protein n=1 Tax=Alkalibacter rhizosphaerae TaxID=2815577 RepID=A0A975AJC9_9FIRM|nr:hypothetical protein [Alkalibacter rhizosphaerae]QSX09609.1 hypothetical protein J0B03_06025 [Alkalibacter rhizosphaerae]QSX09611.1 hypothetical protein J0B03_06050 [Alkalibacter rhizosphaerae]